MSKQRQQRFHDAVPGETRFHSSAAMATGWRLPGCPFVGPAPLAGAILAGVLWGTILAAKQATYQPPPWAVAPPSYEKSNAGGQPQTVQAAKPLPQTGKDGSLEGYQPGWNVVASPAEVSPTLDVAVKTNVLTSFSVKGPSVEMEQIVAGGPKGSLFAGVGRGFLVVRDPGVYAVSARFERPPAPTANCLVRLGFGPRRIVSNLIVATPNVAVVGPVAKDYEAASFDLQPGLYSIGWMLTCWHDNEIIGPGKLTVLVRRPGETTLSPVRPDDIVR